MQRRLLQLQKKQFRKVLFSQILYCLSLLCAIRMSTLISMHCRKEKEPRIKLVKRSSDLRSQNTNLCQKINRKENSMALVQVNRFPCSLKQQHLHALCALTKISSFVPDLQLSCRDSLKARTFGKCLQW